MLKFWLNRLDCIADINESTAMANCVKRLKFVFLGLAQPMPSVASLITLNGMEWETENE